VLEISEAAVGGKGCSMVDVSDNIHQ